MKLREVLKIVSFARHNTLKPIDFAITSGSLSWKTLSFERFTRLRMSRN